VELPEREIDRLMSALALGDRAAFEPLYRALKPRALRAARVRLDGPAADDAAQSALLKVFARASEFTPGRPALPWFYAVVANEVRAIGRDGARHGGSRHDPAPLEGLAEDRNPEQALCDAELRRALARAIDALDETAATAIRALLGDAERPALEAPAFRKRVSRAYAALRLLLGGEHGE
jgi:RNA polymerase sigma-70 factor (ECF subfamily)